MPPLPPVSPSHLLVIEDNPEDLYLLEKALQHQGITYDLTRYADGEQAIRAITTHTLTIPDLILLDLNLPRREGFEVLRAIRSTPSLVGVPVGIFTSSTAPSDRHRVDLLGAERYIHKPAQLADFINEVGRAVAELLPRPSGPKPNSMGTEQHKAQHS